MEDSPSFFLPTARHRYTRAQKIAMVEELMRPILGVGDCGTSLVITAVEGSKKRSLSPALPDGCRYTPNYRREDKWCAPQLHHP
jgi:hypothetical protein